MKKKDSKKPKKKISPEQVSAEDALDRMNSFSSRKEKFVAAIKKSKN